MANKIPNWGWFVLGVPALLILPWVGDYFYPAASHFSDLTISHVPNALIILNSLMTNHSIALWSPGIMSGYPLAGDPLSGLWYPPSWLALLLPPPAGFNLVFLAHVVWGGIGLTCWLRGRGMSLTAAAVGGLAFELLPKAAAHFAAGHITLLYATAWTPWLLLAEDQRRAGTRRAFLPAGILGITLLADPRWAAYSGALWLGYVIFGRPGSAGGRVSSQPAGTTNMVGKLKALGMLLLQPVLAAAFAAPLLLPLIEFTRLSTRSQMTPADINTMALPPVRFLGLIYPDSAGNAEWVVYAGGVVFILAAASLFIPEIRRKASFWMGVFGAACVLAPGLPGQLGDLTRLVPGVNLLRVPARAMLLAGLGAAILAAYLVDHVSRLKTDQSGSANRALNLFLVGISALAILMAGGVWVLSGQMPLSFGWGTAAVLASALWIALRLRNRIPAGAAVVILIAMVAADSGGMDLLMTAKRKPAEVLQEGIQAAQYLASQPGIFRVYSPSYSLPQLTAAANNLELADGIDPLQLQTYSDFFQRASGVPDAGYSVTLPGFASGDPKVDNRGYHPETRLLGLLNVRYIAAEYDLRDPTLQLVRQFGETRIYLNLNELPRAWVQAGGSANAADVQSAKIRSRSPNQVVISANGSGLLVLSEVAYPGWQVRVDGVRQEIQVVEGLLRGVALEGGSHEVIFDYRPTSVAAGLIIGGLAWGAAAVFLLLGRRRVFVK